ncbi:hypothetical protein [Helicobacter labetoulli]|uniref:hypothetical protein n=1 Tax=Helicobacter labetoulli TaxID=2315333 RepID=UPI000EF73084|nr:hypothetical protein [Helicobacter labetoulli]
MKKIFIFFIFMEYIYAFTIPCSYVSDTNSSTKHENIRDFIEDENTDIRNYWKDTISPIVENIKEESNKREEKMKKLKAIETERLVIAKKIEFLLKQENELLGNFINIESERER